MSTSDELFRQAMHGVRPLKTEERYMAPRQLPKRSKELVVDESEAWVPLFSTTPTQLFTAACELSYFDAGLPHKTRKAMRTGDLCIEHRIDLHQHTAEEAGERIHRGLRDCQMKGTRYLLIIHGKGLRSHGEFALLKSLTHEWLKAHSEVLAFHSAVPSHGGRGAVYVLLKRQEIS